MRVLHSISVSLIDVDRWPFRGTLPLVRHLEAGGGVPPIHVAFAPHGRYRILDGRHRLLAFKLLERPRISAKLGIYP